MAAFSHQFGPPVQRCSGACLENRTLFSEAQHASPYPWLVRRDMRYDFPSDLMAFPIGIVTPECFREIGSIAFSLMFKALVVVIKASFKLGFTATEVMHGVVIR